MAGNPGHCHSCWEQQEEEKAEEEAAERALAPGACLLLAVGGNTVVGLWGLLMRGLVQLS
ncbi:hypothetical protein [Streptomyces violascens]|uniref:hypothetical protein n=1 Tax=Streptomyces violascens TaxID=67381 RepID=UPI00365A22E2